MGNRIEGCRIYDTGRWVAEFGEGVYIGTAWVDWAGGSPDRSDGNLIVGNHFGPDVRAEHVDAKAGTTGGVIRENTFDGTGLIMSRESWPASWVIISGSGYTVEGNIGAKAPRDGFFVRQPAPGWGNDNVFTKNTADVQGPGYGFHIGSDTSGNRVLCDNVVLNAGAGFASVTCQEDSVS
jgi:hypothetical protein